MAWSLAHALFIQGCPGHFTGLGTEHWVQGTPCFMSHATNRLRSFRWWKSILKILRLPTWGSNPETSVTKPSKPLKWIHYHPVYNATRKSTNILNRYIQIHYHKRKTTIINEIHTNPLPFQIKLKIIHYNPYWNNRKSTTKIGGTRENRQQYLF